MKERSGPKPWAFALCRIPLIRRDSNRVAEQFEVLPRRSASGEPRKSEAV